MKEQVEAFNEAVQKQCENVATVSVPEQFYRGTLLVLVEAVLIHTNIILLQYISTDGHGMML